MKEYSIDEYQNIVKQHPELFTDNETDYQVHITKKKGRKER